MNLVKRGVVSTLIILLLLIIEILLAVLHWERNSNKEIIVISENFFDREWTELELKELLERQNEEGQKLILPILHNITPEQLKAKYPIVADIQAIESKDNSYEKIALLFARQLIKRYK